MPAEADRSLPARAPLLVDAHVHIHEVFELDAFLFSAARNVADAARALGYGEEQAVGVLMLAEGAGEGAFARLRSGAGLANTTWTTEATREPESVIVREAGRLRLIAIAGRQIVTREGVEVLSLCSVEEIPDGMTMAETLDAVRRANALPVLPWGFGKWTLRRGALVASVLRTQGGAIFMGDNGGRLRAARTPPLLAEARRLSVPVLPGSDPLPFRDEQSRAASFGFLADVRPDPDRPADELRAWLRALRTQPRPYGPLETLGRFCRNQARMQWRKRRSRFA